jgi:hypothetical protein
VPRVISRKTLSLRGDARYPLAPMTGEITQVLHEPRD